MQRLDSVEQIIEKYAVTSDPIKSKIYVSLGCLFVFFAIIGVFVPGWPTVSWQCLQHFCFLFPMKDYSVGV